MAYDGYLEGYHFQAAHTNTVATRSPSNRAHYEGFGPHIRLGFPQNSITRLAELPRDRPVALVLGNEETGVSAPVLAACRRQVRISGPGRVQSLNVAQAAAVFLHALSG